jgi:hypothetical protein
LRIRGTALLFFFGDAEAVGTRGRTPPVTLLSGDDDVGECGLLLATWTRSCW